MALVISGRVRAAALVSLSLSAATCSATSEIGTVEADLYDVAVECDSTTGECRDDTGAIVAPSSLTSWAFTSTESERFDDGLFVYFELQRDDGTVAHVQLDLPRTGSTDAASFVYVETEGDRRVFESSSARGHVEIPMDVLGDDCICTDGRFELIFVDPGEDGLLHTRDDSTRRLSRARFASAAGFCLDRYTFRAPTEDVVEIAPVNRCRSTEPDPSPPPDHGDDGSGTYEPTSTSTSCGSETSSSDDSGCGSDSSSSESDGCGSDSSSESDGCGGDSSSGSSGCEGDSSGGGCEGDSAGGGCEGDSGGGCGGSGGCDTPKVAKNLGRMQLGLCVGFALLFVRRKRPK